MAGVGVWPLTHGLIVSSPHGNAVGVFDPVARDWEAANEVLIPQIDSIFGHSYTARLVYRKYQFPPEKPVNFVEMLICLKF